jgi:hypothetical protein
MLVQGRHVVYVQIRIMPSSVSCTVDTERRLFNEPLMPTNLFNLRIEIVYRVVAAFRYLFRFKYYLTIEIL